VSEFFTTFRLIEFRNSSTLLKAILVEGFSY